MVSNEDKREFLAKIPLYIGHSEDLQKELHNLLIRDTNGGKLYKYRAVNENNITCLKEGTMYCPTPDKFNDPFDIFRQ